MFDFLHKIFTRPTKVINEGSTMGYFLYERIMCPECNGVGLPKGIGFDYPCGPCRGTGKIVIEVPYFRAKEKER